MSQKWHAVTRTALQLAVDESSTRRQVLSRLGFSLAPYNHPKLEAAALKLGVELPAPPKTRMMDVISDFDPVDMKTIFDSTGSIPETLRRIGLGDTHWTREKLRKRFVEVGIDPTQRYQPTSIHDKVIPSVHHFEGGMDHPVAKGNVAEIAVAASLAKAGFIVLTPMSVTRYDMAIDTSEGIKTVQCKHARLEGDRITFSVKSINPLNGKTRTYGDEVDFFCAWSSDLDKSYLIPIDDLRGAGATVTLHTGTDYRQSTGIRYAADYEI